MSRMAARASGVAVRARCQKTGPYAPDDLGMGTAKVLREEPRQRRLGDRRHSAMTDRFDPRRPRVAVHLRGGAGRHERGDALWGQQSQRHRDHAAERYAADRRALDLRRVHDREDVAGQDLERGVLRGFIRSPVASAIDAQQPEVSQQSGKGAVPKRHVRANGVEQDEDLLVGLSVEPPVEPQAVVAG